MHFDGVAAGLERSTEFGDRFAERNESLSRRIQSFSGLQRGTFLDGCDGVTCRWIRAQGLLQLLDLMLHMSYGFVVTSEIIGSEM